LSWASVTANALRRSVMALRSEHDPEKSEAVFRKYHAQKTV